MWDCPCPKHRKPQALVKAEAQVIEPQVRKDTVKKSWEEREESYKREVALAEHQKQQEIMEKQRK